MQVEELKKLDDLFIRQKAFGYTYEDIQKYLVPVVTEGKDPIGSMGNDTSTCCVVGSSAIVI